MIHGSHTCKELESRGGDWPSGVHCYLSFQADNIQLSYEVRSAMHRISHGYRRCGVLSPRVPGARDAQASLKIDI